MLQAYLVDLCILAKMYMLWPNDLVIATAWVFLLAHVFLLAVTWVCCTVSMVLA